MAKNSCRNRFQSHPLPSLSSAEIKAAAASSMFLDHLACGLFRPVSEGRTFSSHPEWLSLFLRQAGRLSFPVFCFFLVEGFFLTRCRRRYFLRMLGFAFLSEIPFNLCMNKTVFFPEHQNVLFTMALGLILMESCDRMGQRISAPLDRFLYSLVLAFFFGIAATMLRFDYKLPGLLLICILYLLRDSRLKQCAFGYLSFIWEPASAFGFLLLMLYNGQRGKQGKYFFYLFYPCHLFLIYLLSLAPSPS